MDHKSDDNQREIVQALRESGASVLVLSGVGRGCPDLLVGHHGLNFLLEVKNLFGRGVRLTPSEKKFMENWKGIVFQVTSAEEALQLLSVEFVR